MKMVPYSFKSSLVRTLNKVRSSNISNAVQVRWLNISCQVERLSGRGLIRVSGSDTTPFLQGIVTNDMKHLQGNSQSLYTMFLNTKGRVLYDSIIYRTKEENTFLIECDKEALKDLEKHIKMYKLRKKVNIDSVDDEMKLWVIFNPKVTELSSNNVVKIKQEIVVPCSSPSYEDKRDDICFSDITISKHSLVYADPRLLCLGSRVIAPENEDVEDLLQHEGVNVKSPSPLTYRMFRYRLGVGEGISELPVGKCFPLEANCDYLHGVSFHKGCYIGQELTARTHHTGVVRKRLMPLLLHAEASSEEFPTDMPIQSCTDEKKPAIGKLRGIEKNCALGLVRITEALESGKFKIGHIEGETFRPSWWPQELPKERIDSGSGKKS